jgi:uronate dehydrogenase
VSERAAPDGRSVLITGAAGRVGTVLRAGLPALGWQLRLLDLVPLPDEPDAVVADIRDSDRLAAAMAGVGAVVHLAGLPREDTFDRILAANIEGSHRVFEAARQAGVRRVVYASSNHAVGFTPRQPVVGIDIPARPDTYNGLSKVFGEALGRLFVDKYGLQVACLRIGSCFPRPTTVRQLSTWLSPGDAVRLVHACLTTPDLGYAVVYGISANTRGWWDLGPGCALGYRPVDDAEAYAAEVLAARGDLDPDDPEYAYLGGLSVAVEPPG